MLGFWKEVCSSMSGFLQKLIVILGPTASGKTSLSIKLCKKFNCSVVSADSRQVYKGLDIGSSKVTEEERQDIEHYLIDVVDISENFTLAQYQKMAFEAIDTIVRKKKIPFMVGGTGLYIDSVVKNILIPKVEPNEELRSRLERVLHENGRQELSKILLSKDPEAGDIIDLLNPRRVIRAIEIIEKIQKPLKDVLRKRNKPRYDVLKIGILWPREQLYKRSDQVLDDMVKRGLIQEVEGLLKQGVTHERLQSFGLEYRYVSLYLQKKFYSLEDMLRELKYKKHAYIRRQITWFKRDSTIHWVNGEEAFKKSKILVENFLDKNLKHSYSSSSL